ncbi:hypothetical protein OH77DRAFT_542482 [Trametes cingulata]|nr:hypothetical protein OH77DRAFT_542482 [Trametes cingulata]
MWNDRRASDFAPRPAARRSSSRDAFRPRGRRNLAVSLDSLAARNAYARAGKGSESLPRNSATRRRTPRLAACAACPCSPYQTRCQGPHSTHARAGAPSPGLCLISSLGSTATAVHSI